MSSPPPSLPTTASPPLAVLDTDPDIDMSLAPEPFPVDAPLSFDGIKEEDFGMDSVQKNHLSADPLVLVDVEPRVPLKKDVSLREFLGRMDEYAPIIPDAVTAHALTLAGLPPPGLSHPTPNTTATTAPAPPTTPLHLSRLLALATQKFIADIAADAYQYSRMRTGNMTSNSLNPLNAAQQPGAPVPGGATGAAMGAAPGPGGAKEKAGTGQHVLGMQRPGFGGGGQGGGQGRTVLTMEDLGMAVGEYGVSVRRGEFYR